MTGDDLRPIETAPRDGTEIRLYAPEDGMQAVMAWKRTGTNDLTQPGVFGIWEGGGFTWSEENGGGPTHWAPHEPGSAFQWRI